MLEERLQVEQMLTEGMNILDIADETGIRVKKLQEYKKDWTDAKNKKEIIDMVTDDEDGLEKAMTTFTQNLDAKGIETKTITENIEAVKGLQVLDIAIQSTCKKALKRADMFLSEDNLKLTPAQWKTIVDGIASMYSSIFVPQGTNINIMNNNGGGDTELGGWKGGLR